MNINIKSYKDYLIKAIFPIAFIFPFVLSFGSCSEGGALWSCIATVILSLFIDKFDEKKTLPLLFIFTVISFLINSFGYLTAIVALLISGIIICFGDKLKPLLCEIYDSPVVSGIMFATALLVTVLQTTNYFGIGATGNTAREMIESYVSLGFHGNWRGVLYGTIVMVIMITFPRKFKNLNKIIHASFIGLVISIILNLFLNPSDMITSINEITDIEIKSFNLNISLYGLVISVFCGILIAFFDLLMISNDNAVKTDFVKSGIINIILAPFLCLLPQKIDKKLLNNIPIAALTALILFLTKDLIIRIPVHSCAVILIVSAWQAVEWKRLKSIFKKPVSVSLFLIPIFLFLIY